jgi:hypothetical protein
MSKKFATGSPITLKNLKPKINSFMHKFGKKIKKSKAQS